ncbi:CapA family protein [Dysgonomonas sp. 25]|uniref:CapA family protein n=1 Tax=Dysgonomonas sp. 25 TaxID=2302933 RepID=UPI0013D2ACAB|nr:CapA family protein [Dysgonomonas sp. 25]NDV68901.1 CapA family protein [Dysgonomonas sp. 25]
MNKILSIIALALIGVCSLKAAGSDTIKVIAVGDIMMGTIVPDGKHLPPNNDCSPQLSEVKDILASGDITFGNLEGVLTDSKASAKRCNNPRLCYTFGMPTSFVNCLKDAGFNLLSVANNHVGDFGEQGRKSTVETLDKAGIHYAGLKDYQVSTTFAVDGVKYGFCAFAPNRGTVDVRDIPAAQELVRKLAAECDVVIVSFHAGAEGAKYQHVTRKLETFVGENRGNVYEFAHKMIDAGADILLGHGPHVTRAVEVYKDRFITYSMGNFCTYDRVNISGVNGLAPIFKIYTDKEGKFLKAEVVSTYQTKYEPVRIDEGKRVLKVIQDLTKQDFPEMKEVISISDEGLILPAGGGLE